jgi:tetratricopeptide (TPR) repeat protein
MANVEHLYTLTGAWLFGNITIFLAERTMPHVATLDEVRDQLRTIIASKNAALVIGAGASASSGGPVTSELASRMRDRFKDTKIEPEADFLKLGSAISDTPQYGRAMLVRFITQQFENLQPSDAYKQLPRVRWRALFTTNYDDLIEQAYRTPSKVQSLQVVHPSEAGFMLPREDHLVLMYLMGTIRVTQDSEHSPAVSWADFLRYVQERAPVLRSLRSLLIDGGQVIYVGYSFNDFLLDSVLDEALQRVGQRSMPYGYAVLTGWPSDRVQPIHKITSRKVIPIEGSFEDFAEIVREIADEASSKPSVSAGGAVRPSSPAKGKTVMAGEASVTLSEDEVSVYGEAFDIPDVELQTSVGLKQDEERRLAAQFLRGESLGWLPFVRGWAFKRSSYSTVWNAVSDRYRAANPRDNSVILVHGPAGLGKSVMAHQLAYDLISKQNVLVLVAKPLWRSRPDLKLLDRYCDDLESNLPDGASLPRLALIVDEAELLDRTTPYRAVSYMRTRGRALSVILFARTNEYYRLTGGNPPPEAGNVDLLDVRIEERIDDAETVALIRHMSGLGLWGNRLLDESFWTAYVRNELHSSFFDTVYSLVEQAQKPLAERVASEYDRLSPLAKRAYVLIAATHQFAIPLKMEVLMRALAVPFPEFEDQVIRSDALHVLVSDEQSSDLNLFFRGRTRLISQLVFDRALPKRPDQLAALKSIVGAVNPSDMFGSEELDMVRLLLVQILGPRGFDRRFAPDDLAELFATATSAVDDDVLEHHYGLVEHERSQYVSARAHLEKALELSDLLPSDLAALRESKQNIENSLALVIASLAMEAIKRRDFAAADELFNEARTHFSRAKTGTFPNPAAYDAMARMLWNRANRLYTRGTGERAVALGEALDVVSEGIDNVGQEHRPNLVELRAKLLDELGFEADAVAELKKRVEQGPNAERARYAVILSRLLIQRDDGEGKRKRIQQAFSYAVKATELDANYFSGWKIAAELYAQLHPDDLRGSLEWFGNAVARGGGEDNCSLLYEYAVIAFLLRRYELSASTFSKLRKASRGHSSSNGLVEIAGERGGGEAFEWEGKVGRRSADGGIVIRCEELTAFGELWFNTRGQRYYTPRQADTVRFLVGFNFKGPLAVDLRRA